MFVCSVPNIVRDAVARLPNGEGTRSEICEMLRDSQFLAPEASNVTLNSVVSGALDRLHYERDPCVRYDSHKKSWVYLHRDRTQEQFGMCNSSAIQHMRESIHPSINIFLLIERLHHNRSYTKSTKSRSNTSRKSRKSSKTQPQSSSPAAASTTTIVKVEPTTVISTPVSATPTVTLASTIAVTPTTMTLTTTKLPPVGTLIAKTTMSSANPQLVQFTTSNVRQISTPVSAESASVMKTSIAASRPGLVATGTATSSTGVRQILSVDGNSQIITSQAGSVRKLPLNEVLAAASSLGSTIRFATVPGSQQIVAVSGTTGTVNLNAGGSEQQTSGIVFRTTGGANLGSQLTAQALSGAGGSMVSPQTLQLQVQGLPSSAKAVPVSVATGSSVPSSQASGVGNASINSGGQLLLNPSTVIRLANSIRLPEGVRFAQVRLPVQQTNAQQLNSNPVRLPQQRIILTRAALGGQTQAQVILVEPEFFVLLSLKVQS